MTTTARKKFSDWTLWAQIPLFIIFYLLCTVLFACILVLPFYYDQLMAPGGFEKLMEGNIRVMLLVQLSTLSGMITAFRLMDGSFDSPHLRDIWKVNFKLFGRGILISILLMAPAVIFLVALKLVSFHYVSIRTLPFSLLFFLLVAIVEEAIFRGYIFIAIQRKTSTTSAIFISAFIFAAVHVTNPNFGWIGMINIFLSGVLLAVVYSISRTLSAPIGVHFAWNFLQAIFGFAVSGQGLTGMFSIDYDARYPMLTGGAFGIEGSLLLIPVAGIIIYFLMKRPQLLT